VKKILIVLTSIIGFFAAAYFVSGVYIKHADKRCYYIGEARAESIPHADMKWFQENCFCRPGQPCLYRD